MSRIVIAILIYHRHRPIDSINLFNVSGGGGSKTIFSVGGLSSGLIQHY
jgi:hypothetical protein